MPPLLRAAILAEDSLAHDNIFLVYVFWTATLCHCGSLTSLMLRSPNASAAIAASARRSFFEGETGRLWNAASWTNWTRRS